MSRAAQKYHAQRLPIPVSQLLTPAEAAEAALKVMTLADSGSIWAVVNRGQEPFLVPANDEIMENHLES